MKKRLSLLVAVLMMLTLVPASAFAVEAKYSSVVSVDDSEGTATFSATFKIEQNDVEAIKEITPGSGSVAVQLVGDDVYFEELHAGIADAQGNAPTVNLTTGSAYGVQAVNEAALGKDVVLRIYGKVKFDNAADGEYKIVYDLSGIGLSTYPERVFAKLADKDGGFTKVTGKVKKIARGNNQDVAAFEVTGKPGDQIEIKLPSTDFEFVNPGQMVKYGTVPVIDTKKGTATFTLQKTKAVVTAFLKVTKDAPKGEVELEVVKTETIPAEVNPATGEVIKPATTKEYKDYVVVAEYVDYAVTMELVKALQEKLANGDTYKVDVKVKTSDRDLLPKVIDFEVDGAVVKVLNKENFDNSGAASRKPKKEKFDDNFTWNAPEKGDNEFNIKLEVSPDWDANGDVVLKAKGRGMEELSLVILKVKPVAEMKVEAKEILGGDSKVAVSDIVITETEAGAMKTGEWFGVSLTGLKFAQDVKFDSKGKVVAEGISVKDGDYKLDKDGRTIYFKINAKSKKDAPGKITLKDVEVVSNRSFPFGTHKLDFVHVGPFEKNGKTIKAIVGFKKITTPQGNTIEEAVYEDVEIENVNLISKGGKYAFRDNEHAELDFINDDDFIKVVDKVSKVKKTTIFTLGSADYTVDGVAMKLDTPVFTQDNYTMLPVRAIADALGVDVVWNQENLTATFIDGDIVVSVTQDAKMLYKNGNSYPMVTKATVKADRMFIPVSSVGDAFGLTRDYDYIYNKTSKEVTIYPKAMPAAAEEVKAEEPKAEEVKVTEVK